MRHSELAHVVIRVPIGRKTYLLLRKNQKWNDWNLVGGHVEPGEEGDWAQTAIRECEEELAPLKYMVDFVIVPLFREPIAWGPIASKSAHGKLTRYTAQFFALKFRKSPEECLSRLPPDDFLLASERCVTSLVEKRDMLKVVWCNLPAGFDGVPVAWKTSVNRGKIAIPESKCVAATHQRGDCLPLVVSDPLRRMA